MSRENLKIKKYTDPENVMVVYDIYDEYVMKSIQDAEAVRNNNTQYEKANKKIKAREGHNLKFFKGIIRQTINHYNLFGDNSEIGVEYLTLTGWKSNVGAWTKPYLNSMVLATPSIDKDVGSGLHNNAISDDEPILMVRLNVFEYE